MKSKYFLIFTSVLIGLTLIIISVNYSPQISLLFKSESINGVVEKCDSANTDYGMKYSYSGHFQIDSMSYEFNTILVGGQRFKIGQHVKILYNSQDPKENLIDSFGEKYSSVYSISFLTFLLLLILVVYRRVSKTNK